MPVRGFCEHGKVWTTCPICGKDIIASQSGRRAEPDEFGEPRPKKKAVKRIPEEPGEAAEWKEEEESGSADS